MRMSGVRFFSGAPKFTRCSLMVKHVVWDHELKVRFFLPRPVLFHDSTAVVQLTVNQLVPGSIPGRGAILKYTSSAGCSRGHCLQWSPSVFQYDIIEYGELAEWLRQRFAKPSSRKGRIGSNPILSARVGARNYLLYGGDRPIEGLTNLQINQYSLQKMFTRAIVETIHGVRPRNGLHNFWSNSQERPLTQRPVAGNC